MTSECGVDVLEVHNGTDLPGQMWWRFGHVSTDGKTITWQPSQPYDTGWNPKIAWFTTPIQISIRTTTIAAGAIEVHNGQAGVGPLWYHTAPSNPLGEANNLPAVVFSPPCNSTSGTIRRLPSTTTTPDVRTQSKSHNSAASFGPELYHAGTYTCPN